MKLWALALLACGIAFAHPALATCNASSNPPANQAGSTTESCNSNGAVRVEVQPVTTGFTAIGADVVTLPGGSAITMFATGHCANGCRVSVPVAFCTNPLTTATATATTGGNECWQANQSVAMPPTSHAISVFSTSASTASGIGSTVP